MSKQRGSGAVPVALAGFDRVPHLRYRLCLPAVLGLPLLAVYDALLSFAWRQDAYGPPVLIAHASKGFIVAQVSQATLAQVTGLERARISGYLQRLAQLGWISALPQRSRRDPAIYELGLRRNERGAWAEVTYAEATMSRWYDSADKQAKELHGTSLRKLPADLQAAICRSVVLDDVPVQHNKRATSRSRTKTNKFNTLDRPSTSDATDVLHNNQNATSVSCQTSKIKDLRGKLPLPSEKLLCSPSTSHGAPRAQQSARETASNVAESLTNPDFFFRYVYRTRRISFTTFRKSLRTTYSEPSFHVAQSAPSVASSDAGAAAFACSLRSPASPALPASDSLTSDADLDRLPPHSPARPQNHPAGPNPSPVPRAPSPAPSAAFALAAAKHWANTKLGERVTKLSNPSRTPPTPSKPPSVEEPPQMALGASQTTNPPPSPSEPSEVSPAGQTDAFPAASGRLADLASVVEAAKARSREAMEAKLAKQRAKERKVANLTSDGAYRSQKAGAMRLEHVWREEMQHAFPHVPQISWFKRERNKVTARKEGKLIADLLDGYGGDETLVADLLRFFVQKWPEFCALLGKPTGSVPTLGLFYACHATVAAEQARASQSEGAILQYENWKAENASNPFAVPPSDLEAAYKAAVAKKAKKAKP